ncbi:MAG: AAA family ATPase [Sarcina sp.]
MEEYLDLFDDENKISKSFNTSGACTEDKHYMVNINNKLRQIIKLVQHDKYFVINRPRQYGKTTTLSKLEKVLKTRYKVLSLDFEMMTSYFESEKTFCNEIRNKLVECLGSELNQINSLGELGDVIEEITSKNEVVLMIDEVDKISNHRLFLDFLGILRGLYLARTLKKTTTFKSVILVGVHDIKNLKLKFRDDTEVKYNSPWNIAVNFNVDMSFSAGEISTMLSGYSVENNLTMNIEVLSEELYKFTSGYPFLVSRVCQIIDEDIILEKRNWNVEDIHRGIKLLLDESNTLFDDLIKNLENNKKLFEYIYSVLVLGIPKVFNISNPIINLGVVYGYLNKSKDGVVEVSNQILREYIYNYMVSRADNYKMSGYNFKSNFITEDNGLDMRKVLLKFQQFT